MNLTIKKLLVPATLIATLSLSGCVSVEDASGEAATIEAPAADGTAVLADYAGQNGNDVYDDLAALGFEEINLQDATSEERLVLDYSNWYVCSQIPAAGSTVDLTDTITLLSVKNTETCPSGEASGAEESASSGGSSGTLAVGDTWTDGSFNVTLNGARKVSKDGLGTAADNDFYLVLDVSIENLTDEEQTFSSLLNFDLTGSDGYSYDVAIFVETKGSMDGSARPGKALRGEIAFDVADVESYEFGATPNLFGDTGYFEISAGDIK